MGRTPCCDKNKVKRGPWSPEEDEALKNYLHKHGTAGNWIALPQKAGLRRCGKSCRLRWLNYLRPDIKHGSFTQEEDNIIFSLYSRMGSRWSIIASHLPGRTDNDVKNHWNTKLKKKLIMATAEDTSKNPAFPSKTTSSPALPIEEPIIAPDFAPSLGISSSTLLPLPDDITATIGLDHVHGIKQLMSFDAIHNFPASTSSEGAGVPNLYAFSPTVEEVSSALGANANSLAMENDAFGSYDTMMSGIWPEEDQSTAAGFGLESVFPAVTSAASSYADYLI